MGPPAKAVRVRRNVLKLGKPGDDLDWYAKGVAVLQARPIRDPTSWRYLAAVHGYPGHGGDPLARSGESLPSARDQGRFWNQCQHQTWFFLPWHRGYLALFEEIIADAVVQAGGPRGWALPYWNYSDGTPLARELPAAFREPLDAHGKPNPLWVAGRTMTTAGDQLPATHVSLDALLHGPFAGSAVGGDPGFGGPRSGFSHFGGVNGRLENLPHNQVHVDVGGLMSDPNTAALDPIFWVHHANVDRLWEVWRSRDPDFTDPAQTAWLKGQTFHLHDARGKIVAFAPAQMRDTIKVRHGYRYDDVKDPFSRPLARPLVAAARMMSRSPQPPHLVAATDDGLALTGTSASKHVRFNQPARRAAIARVSERPVRAFLNLENVTGTVAAASYDVYINAPSSGASPLLAGHLNAFGVPKASDPKSKHGGSGITTVLEIGPQIEQLRRERQWSGDGLDVSFVPSGPRPERLREGTIALQIGRISVYYS